MISEMTILVRAVITHTRIGVEAIVRPMMRTAIHPARATNAVAVAEMWKLVTRAGNEAATCSKLTAAATITQTMTIATTGEERSHLRGEMERVEVALDKIESKRLVSMTKSKTWPSSSRMSSLKSSRKFASGGEICANGLNIQTFNMGSKELFWEWSTIRSSMSSAKSKVLKKVLSTTALSKETRSRSLRLKTAASSKTSNWTSFQMDWSRRLSSKHCKGRISSLISIRNSSQRSKTRSGTPPSSNCKWKRSTNWWWKKV